MQKAEWRVEVRGEDLLPPLTLHHPGHPGGSTPFLAPQPLQGPSKPEPRPLPPAPGPPAPTFRYHWYIAILYYISIQYISHISQISVLNHATGDSINKKPLIFCIQQYISFHVLYLCL